MAKTASYRAVRAGFSGPAAGRDQAGVHCAAGRPPATWGAQSEVIRAILLEDSPYVGHMAHLEGLPAGGQLGGRGLLDTDPRRAPMNRRGAGGGRHGNRGLMGDRGSFFTRPAASADGTMCVSIMPLRTKLGFKRCCLPTSTLDRRVSLVLSDA